MKYTYKTDLLTPQTNRIFIQCIHVVNTCIRVSLLKHAIKTPKVIVPLLLNAQTKRQTLPQTMADNRYDRLRAASTCGMIGACVSKLRVVSWITIDWQNSPDHTAYVQEIDRQRCEAARPTFPAATLLDHKARREYCIRQTRVDFHPLASVYISIEKGEIGTPLRFTRRFTSRLGGRFISTLMSQLEAAGLPLFRKGGRGARLVPARGPGVPIKGVLP